MGFEVRKIGLKFVFIINYSYLGIYFINVFSFYYVLSFELGVGGIEKNEVLFLRLRNLFFRGGDRFVNRLL